MIWAGSTVWLASVAGAHAVPPGYMDHAALTKAANDLGGANARCKVDVIGASRQGRGLLLLTLAADQAEAGKRPALLITAGLDARHRVGPETALRVARQIVDQHADLLAEMTVYVIPCVNPDGMELNAGAVNFGHIGTLRVNDDDRDGTADENGPSDLNGDGFITQMRRLDPPLDDKATHMADPAEPRLLKTPDASRGERATYSLYIEGIDSDDDGLIAEDGPGMVDLERNFMHRYPEHAVDAGPRQICEPESAALAQFVLEHRNIVAAITYGRHDNIAEVPDGKGTDISGQGPQDLDLGDVEYYKDLSRAFKRITGQEPAPVQDTAGSFHNWLYAQRGIPSFATFVWGRQEPSNGGDGKPSEKPPSTAPESSGQNEVKDQSEPADPVGAKWLAYSDRDRNGEGFIAWQPVDHPTLGKVEIGGFVPGFQMNPPADQLETLAEKQTAFALEVMTRRPRLVVQGPEVTKLANGLYDVRFGIVNDGYLPTATAMARKARSVQPTVVKLSTPLENIISGERVSKAFGIGGSGDRFIQHWIIRADDAAEITIELLNPHLGDQTISFRATATRETASQEHVVPATSDEDAGRPPK